MALKTLFTDHPASVNETYGQHMASAGAFAGRMLLGALACAVHALLPFLFERTGSAIVAELHERMIANRTRASAPPSAEQPARRRIAA